MTQDTGMQDADVAPLRQLQVAEFELTVGPLRIKTGARLTPVGFLAIGAMVTGILLSASCVVWTATSAARRRAERRPRPD